MIFLSVSHNGYCLQKHKIGYMIKEGYYNIICPLDKWRVIKFLICLIHIILVNRKGFDSKFREKISHTEIKSLFWKHCFCTIDYREEHKRCYNLQLIMKNNVRAQSEKL